MREGSLHPPPLTPVRRELRRRPGLCNIPRRRLTHAHLPHPGQAKNRDSFLTLHSRALPGSREDPRRDGNRAARCCCRGCGPRSGALGSARSGSGERLPPAAGASACSSRERGEGRGSGGPGVGSSAAVTPCQQLPQLWEGRPGWRMWNQAWAGWEEGGCWSRSRAAAGLWEQASLRTLSAAAAETRALPHVPPSLRGAASPLPHTLPSLFGNGPAQDRAATAPRPQHGQ